MNGPDHPQINQLTIHFKGVEKLLKKQKSKLSSNDINLHLLQNSGPYYLPISASTGLVSNPIKITRYVPVH